MKKILLCLVFVLSGAISYASGSLRTTPLGSGDSLSSLIARHEQLNNDGVQSFSKQDSVKSAKTKEYFQGQAQSAYVCEVMNRKNSRDQHVSFKKLSKAGSQVSQSNKKGLSRFCCLSFTEKVHAGTNK